MAALTAPAANYRINANPNFNPDPNPNLSITLVSSLR